MEVVASTRGTSHPNLCSRTRPSGRWSQDTFVASMFERLLKQKAFQYMSDATSRKPCSKWLRTLQSPWHASVFEVCQAWQEHW